MRGRYPHHFLQSFGREWENPRASERGRKIRLYRWLGKREAWASGGGGGGGGGVQKGQLPPP